MPAGTLEFTNGSNSVTGTGTTLTADVEATDFIIVVIGGTSYMVGVTSVESDTGLTLVRNFDGPTTGGLTYRVVPVQTMQLITSQLSADTSRAFRELFLDKSNWQAFYASTGDITITLPDGTSITGPSWPEMQSVLAGKADTTAVNAKAAKGANSDITSLTGLTTALSIAQGGTGAITASAARAALGVTPANIGALPIAGGTMTAGINSSSTGPGLLKTASAATSGGINYLGQATFNSNQYMTIDGTLTSNNMLSRIVVWNTSAHVFGFYDNGNGVCDGSWVGGSDERFKGNIADFTDGLVATLSCRHVTYDKQDGGREIGIIAQDVERFAECAVFNSGKKEFGNGRVIEDFKGLNTAGFAAAAHGNAISSLFELLDLALNDPDAARSKIAEYKAAVVLPVPLTDDQKIFGGKTLDEMPADTDFTDADLPAEDEVLSS